MGFLDKAKELGGAALVKGKELGGQALEKGKDLAQITKLNLDITAIETKINDSKKNIGDLIVKNKITVKNEDVNKELDNINNLLTEIETKKAEISELEKKTKG